MLDATLNGGILVGHTISLNAYSPSDELILDVISRYDDMTESSWYIDTIGSDEDVMSLTKMYNDKLKININFDEFKSSSFFMLGNVNGDILRINVEPNTKRSAVKRYSFRARKPNISFDNDKKEIVIDNIDNIMSLVNSDKLKVSNNTSPLEYDVSPESNTNKCILRLLSDVDMKFISKVILTPEKQEKNSKRLVLTIYYVLGNGGKSIISKVEASIEVPYDTMDKMDCSAKTENMYGLTDKVTNQIMNTKRMCITFYLDKFDDGNKWNQVKYLDDIIMSYLTQMIPSTTILSIKYVTRNN